MGIHALGLVVLGVLSAGGAPTSERVAISVELDTPVAVEASTDRTVKERPQVRILQTRAERRSSSPRSRRRRAARQAAADLRVRPSPAAGREAARLEERGRQGVTGAMAERAPTREQPNAAATESDQGEGRLPGGRGPPGETSPGRAITTRPPRVLESPPPFYPLSARRRRAEGLVVVRVRVGSSGRVVEAQVARSSGADDLDRSAVEAVRSWRFHPGMCGAAPVAAWVNVPLRFRLGSASR